MASMLMNTYTRAPKTFTRGKGAWVWDKDGTAFLDASGGLGVHLIGHSHPLWIEAVESQLSKLVHVSNAFEIPQQEALAQKLCSLTGLDKVFFSNTGAEANEAAIKLARLYANKSKHLKHPQIIVMKEGFHGRTMATLSASSNRKVQAGFEPLVQGFIRAPYNDISALEAIAHQHQDVVAVLLEPIQGYGGVQQSSDHYLRSLRALCDEKGWLLIADEIQCGLGRTGKFLACQHADVLPDIITFAKGLGAGIPIGATLTTNTMADYFTPGSHGSTFGGNPLACTSGLAVLSILAKENLIQNAHEQGEFISKTLTEQLEHSPLFKEVRGKGMMIGLELSMDATPVKAYARELGLLIDVTTSGVIRLLPPLSLSKDESLALCEKLIRALDILS